MLCTFVEAAGLVLVIAVGIPYWGGVSLWETPATTPDDSGIGLSFLMTGAILTFFAFIGFEDTINVAEESKNPQRTLPIGIVSAMLAATVLYMAVAITAVSVVPWRELAAAPGPLAEVMARAAPWFPNWGYVAITIFAVANTALLNYVTASRLILGLAREGLLPAALGRIHPRRRTPHIAVVALLPLLVALMLAGNISQLASAAVLLLLAVFVSVNLALLMLQRREGEARGGFEVPAFVPALGALICGALLVNRLLTGDWRAPALAAALLGVIWLIWFLRPVSGPAPERALHE
jgi:amino acid transporter